MSVVILGGAGFVGLNVAEALLASGRDVTIFDLHGLPAAVQRVLERLPGRLDLVLGDVTDTDALARAIVPGVDALVLGAAITANAAREARDPQTILRVNLAQAPALELARDAGVRRVMNLSSAAAYGAAGGREPRLDEDVPADPVGLYAITKLASERIVARLGSLWGLDVVSLRLSGVFGPWERATGVRDTPSPHSQIVALAESRRPALLDRPGLRDWIYAPDVAEAVIRVIDAERLAHPLYNVSSPAIWPVLDWGRALAAHHPGFVCRLTREGEPATVDLHGPADRAPLSTERLDGAIGWSARHGLPEAVAHYMEWRARYGRDLGAES